MPESLRDQVDLVTGESAADARRPEPIHFLDVSPKARLP